MLIALILSVLLEAPHGLLKAFVGAKDLGTQDVLLSLPSLVQEFIDVNGLFDIKRKCSSDPILAYLTYLRSGEVT